jgi:hypothetical protein
LKALSGVIMSKKNEKTTSVSDDFAGTEASAIWSEIKDKKIEMFSLPDQIVNQYCEPVFIEPSKLYLVASATSVLPSLEAAIGPKYQVDLATKYIIVSRTVVPLTSK